MLHHVKSIVFQCVSSRETIQCCSCSPFFPQRKSHGLDNDMGPQVTLMMLSIFVLQFPIYIYIQYIIYIYIYSQYYKVYTVYIYYVHRFWAFARIWQNKLASLTKCSVHESLETVEWIVLSNSRETSKHLKTVVLGCLFRTI